MHLIQLLLPLHDNNGRQISASHFNQVRKELTDALLILRMLALLLLTLKPNSVNRSILRQK